MVTAGRPRMPTKPPLRFVGARAVHEGPGGGLPFPQHVYDAVAAALRQGMAIADMQVNVPQLHGMNRKSLLRLVQKVQARGPVPGRHGTHRNHKKKVTAEHVNFFLLERKCRTGAAVTLNWMRDQLQMYHGVEITSSGLCKVLGKHNICHKKLTTLNKKAFSEFNVELTRRVRPISSARSRRAPDISNLVHPAPVPC